MAELHALLARTTDRGLERTRRETIATRGARLALSLALIAAGACSSGGTAQPGVQGGPGGAGTGGAQTSGTGGAETGGQQATGGAGTGGAQTGGTDQDASAGGGADAPVEAPSAGGPHPPLNGTVKIMVVGSSNEEGTCWRAFLWKKLHDAGINNFHFVGRNVAGPDCGVPGYDKACEAHGGTVVENISADAWLQTFMANPPDIVLQHNGGADLLQGHAYPGVITAYTLAVTQARKVNPHVIYLAAQHTPQGSAKNVMDVIALNAAMVPWAAGITTTESPVILVDLFTGIDQKTDMSDGTHLNVSGSEKVSDRWLALLTPMFKP